MLIVNCDDLGVSHTANVATYRAMVEGVATSATLTVPCPFAREASRMFDGLSVGIHLTPAEAATPGALLNDHMIYPWPRPTRDVFFEVLPGLPVGVSEIFAHPVDDGEELRGYDFSNVGIRTHDAECLIDPTVRELIEQEEFRPVSYRPLRELQRKAVK